MVSAFGKGVLLGIGESVAESLDQASKAFKEKTGKTIDYHLQQGQAEKLRHKKQQRETEEVLQTLSTLTGESDPEKAFNRAGQILTSLGGDLAQAKEVAQQIRKARSIDPNFELGKAITFVENKNVPVQSRADIVKAFATGSRGMYTPDVAPMTPEGILGKIVGEKDIQSKVSSQLSAMGIQPETEEGRIARPASATIDYTMIDPEGVTQFNQAQAQLASTVANTELAKNRLLQGGETLKRLKLLNKDLPEKLRQQTEERAARITNLNTSNGIKAIEYESAKKMGFRMHQAKLDAIHANIIRAKSGSSLESTQAYLVMEEQVLTRHIDDLEQQGGDVQAINENKAKLAYTRKTMASLKAYSTDDVELTSKSSAIATYQSFLERTADLILGQGGLKIEQVGDRIKYELNGNPTQVYNVYMSVNKAFVDNFRNDPRALQYIQGVMQTANPVTSLNNEIRKQVNTNPTTIPLANTVRTNDLELNKVYNLSGLKDAKGVSFLEKRKGLFNFGVGKNKEGKEIYNYPYAIWNGTRFIGIQAESQGILTMQEEKKDNN